MSTATGYFVAGSSWLHRRHPLTKLLGVVLVLLAAFLLPPVVLPVMAVVLLVVAWSAGLLRPVVRAMRIPALLLDLDRRHQRAVLPGRDRQAAHARPVLGHRVRA